MLLADPQIARAVTNIRIRADDQPDVARLSETFVDTGVLNQLHNDNDQIIFGRRGTGKTHVFTYLATRLAGDPACCPVFVDMRMLGSSSQFADVTAPLPERCLSLFRDVMFAARNGIMRHLGEQGGSAEALAELEVLERAFADPATELIPKTLEELTDSKVSRSHKFGASAGAHPAVTAGVGGDESEEYQVKREFEVARQDKIFFPMLAQALDNVLRAAGVRLYLLLDEWSSIPMDIQPYLAEFLRRSVMPLPVAVVKIAALEHRSAFLTFVDGQHIGFELGADIAAARHLDDYYTFEMNPSGLIATYSEILYRHIAAELPERYLETQLTIRLPTELVTRLFEGHEAFVELVQASEGNLRDFIQIFADAFQKSGPRAPRGITGEQVRRAAVDYTYLHKFPNIPTDLRHVMQDMARVLVDQAKRRDFYLPAEYQTQPVIQRLLDTRVLHIARRVVVTPARPGELFCKYVFDYGFMLPFFAYTTSFARGRPDWASPDEHDEKIRTIVDLGAVGLSGRPS